MATVRRPGLRLGYTIAAARQVGLLRIAGLTSLASWFGGGPTTPEPEAQGPALDAAGLARSAGPFTWSRHPLNLAPLVSLWSWPTMTTSLLAFNVTATVYLVLGSLHEEARLLAAYGEAYTAYQRSGVPFYVPWPGRSPLRPVRSIIQPEDSAP